MLLCLNFALIVIFGLQWYQPCCALLSMEYICSKSADNVLFGPSTGQVTTFGRCYLMLVEIRHHHGEIGIVFQSLLKKWSQCNAL